MKSPFRYSTTQRSPFLWKRLRYWMSRLGGIRLQKAKSLHFVTINGHQFKRLVLCDSSVAFEIEQNLSRFLQSRQFPHVVIRYERELWLEYVTGQPIVAIDEGLVEKVAYFYSRLYLKASSLVETDKTIFPYRLERDLHFLNQVGILSDAAAREIQGTAHRLCPRKVWVGFDYTDPVKKNFVIVPSTQEICAVDVEGLVRDYLLGMGAAKALVRWLKPFKEPFFLSLNRHDVPNFQEYYGFVELCFLANWMKRAFFEKDWKAVQPDYFNVYRGGSK